MSGTEVARVLYQGEEGLRGARGRAEELPASGTKLLPCYARTKCYRAMPVLNIVLLRADKFAVLLRAYNVLSSYARATACLLLTSRMGLPELLPMPMLCCNPPPIYPTICRALDARNRPAEGQVRRRFRSVGTCLGPLWYLAGT